MPKNLSQYEEQERQLCTSLFNHLKITDYQFSKGCVAYDTIFTNSKGIKIIGEIKARNFSSMKYSTYILQVDKLKGLFGRALKNSCTKAYYINFFLDESFPENVEFIVFDLTPRLFAWQKTQTTIERMTMNRATCESTTIKIEKEVIMLAFDPMTDQRGSFKK